MTFEVTNVGVDVFGYVFDSFRLDVGTHKFGFGAKNGAFVFEFGELEVEGAGPSKTGGEAFVDSFDLAGEAIRGNDDLLVELVEVIEDIEEFFLGFFLVHNELEVIDDEAVELLEFVVKFFAFAGTDGVDEIGIEVRNGSVEDFKGRIFP